MFVRFWLKSNRGTNVSAVRMLEDGLDKVDIKGYLESWCSNYGAWDHSDNHVQYGYEVLDPPPRDVVEKELKKTTDRINSLRRRQRKVAKILAGLPITEEAEGEK